MQVEVVVFEDYEIIRDKTTQADFIFPVGKPRRKILELKDIRKAFNRFINIKTNKDAIRFARKYGLLNDFKIELELGSPNIETKTSHIGQRSKFSKIHSPYVNMIYLNIETTQTTVLAIKTYKGNICPDIIYWPERSIDIMELCNIKDAEFLNYAEYFEKKYYENPDEGSIFGVIGEFLNLPNSKPMAGWAKYIDDFNKKAKAFLQKENIEFDNTDEKIDEVLKDYMGEPKEKDVKLQYAIRKAREKGRPGERYFVETSIKFNSLLDAFDALWFFAGGVLKQCVTCGRIFVAERSTAKYCSESCKKKAHSARKSH